MSSSSIESIHNTLTSKIDMEISNKFLFKSDNKYNNPLFLNALSLLEGWIELPPSLLLLLKPNPAVFPIKTIDDMKKLSVLITFPRSVYSLNCNSPFHYSSICNYDHYVNKIDKTVDVNLDQRSFVSSAPIPYCSFPYSLNSYFLNVLPKFQLNITSSCYFSLTRSVNPLISDNKNSLSSSFVSARFSPLITSSLSFLLYSSILYTFLKMYNDVFVQEKKIENLLKSRLEDEENKKDDFSKFSTLIKLKNDLFEIIGSDYDINSIFDDVLQDDNSDDGDGIYEDERLLLIKKFGIVNLFEKEIEKDKFKGYNKEIFSLHSFHIPYPFLSVDFSKISNHLLSSHSQSVKSSTFSNSFTHLIAVADVFFFFYFIFEIFLFSKIK
jgi:hypothetical protein